jgi:oxygen-independent coproporphyrinogen-3 oxidase
VWHRACAKRLEPKARCDVHFPQILRGATLTDPRNQSYDSKRAMNRPDSASRQEQHRLAQAYGRPGPRYTSYPTAVDFSPRYDATHYAAALRHADERCDDPWSIYLHIPFCQQRCRFCACSVVASPEHERVSLPYVEALEKEIELVARHLRHRRSFCQMHLGGGTPTYLEPALLLRVYQAIFRSFHTTPGAEISIELDPRVTRAEHLDVLAHVGVNRISLGVQDFDVKVQDEIGRHQSWESTAATVEGSRARGIAEINLDLVYGLPEQSPESISQTARRVLELNPDRIALYGYAHVPSIRGNQKSIDATKLPSPAQRLDLFLEAAAHFIAAGYVEVGMDHFAKPQDPLAIAQANGTMRRNFMGYTTQAGAEILGFGVTAIGEVDQSFAQNAVKLKPYYEKLEKGELPVERGLRRDRDDMLRAAVISQLMCHHRCDKRSIERTYALDSFDETFADARESLAPMQADGLVEWRENELVVSEAGRLFVRNVAMAFDARLKSRAGSVHLPVIAGQSSESPKPRVTQFSQTV